MTTQPSSQGMRLRLFSARVEMDTDRFMDEIDNAPKSPYDSRGFAGFTDAQISEITADANLRKIDEMVALQDWIINVSSLHKQRSVSVSPPKQLKRVDRSL